EQMREDERDDEERREAEHRDAEVALQQGPDASQGEARRDSDADQPRAAVDRRVAVEPLDAVETREQLRPRDFTRRYRMRAAELADVAFGVAAARQHASLLVGERDHR